MRKYKWVIKTYFNGKRVDTALAITKKQACEIAESIWMHGTEVYAPAKTLKSFYVVIRKVG